MLTDHHKIVTMVQAATLRMHNRLDGWIDQGCCEVTHTHSLFHIRFLFTDITISRDTLLAMEPDTFRQRRMAATTTPMYENMLVLIETGNITPKEIWEQKDVWWAEAREAEERWAGFTDDEQWVLSTRLAVALREAYCFAEDWIPTDIEPKGGNYIDIRLRVENP